MNSDRFDGETREFGRKWSRRVLASSTLAALIAPLPLAGVAGKNKGKKRHKKQEICHCASNDPQTCQTIKVSEKSAKEHLKHHCDYAGPCQTRKVGQCTPPPVCSRSNQCGGNTPYCMDSVCVQCRNDDDCQGSAAGSCENGTCVPAFVTCVGGSADLDFVSGPGKPPVSRGSVQLTVPPPPASTTSFAGIRSGEFAGVSIKDLTTLTYSRFVERDGNDNCPSDIPYMVLYIGTTDLIVSEPGGPFECDKWVTRDALKDNWWSPTLNSGAFAPVDAPKPISAFLAAFPAATMTIRNASTPPAECPAGTGGLRIAAGEWGAPGQAGTYVANVSFLIVGVNDETQTFRF